MRIELSARNLIESRKAGEIMEQDNQEIQEELGTEGKIKNWLQDNIRIIISVLIVIAIAGGIYSYSNRGENSASEEEIAMEDAKDIEDDQDESADVVEGDDESEISDEEDSTTEDVTEDDEEEVEIAEPAKEEAEETVSEETGESFIVTAARGDSVTTLSRKALKDYLEKNNDSGLTAEHKIYIEDYLRKNVNHSGGLSVGEEISFSKQLIQNGIEKSKTLNENQLENLEQYSSRVSNL